MIYYFSGTGNTRICALALAKALGSECCEFTVSQLRQPLGVRLRSRDADIVFMFPVYSWGIPPVVRRLLRDADLHFGRDARIWMVATCGDDAGLTASAFRSLMRRHGLKVAGAFSVIMPNTYVCMKGFDVDPAAVADRKLADMPARISHIASVIGEGRPVRDDIVKGRHAWIKSKVIYPYFTAFCMSAKPFEADEDECDGCGLCRRTCPMENIVPGPGNRPLWGDNCALCLRCYHICPKHAINYGDKTRDKGQKKIYTGEADMPSASPVGKDDKKQ